MEEHGFSSFKTDNPKMSVILLCEKLYPISLRNKIKEDLDFLPNLKKDWKTYIKHMCKQAEHVDKGSDTKSKTNSSGSRTAIDTKSSKSSGNKNGHTNNQSDNQNPPKCLNPKCDGYHLLRYCLKTNVEGKKELYKKYREEKQKKQAAKKVQDPHENDQERNNDRISTLFSAVFAENITTTVCADLGSDINLMCPNLLVQLIERSSTIEVTFFERPRRFYLAVSTDSTDN